MRHHRSGGPLLKKKSGVPLTGKLNDKKAAECLTAHHNRPRWMLLCTVVKGMADEWKLAAQPSDFGKPKKAFFPLFK